MVYVVRFLHFVRLLVLGLGVSGVAGGTIWLVGYSEYLRYRVLEVRGATHATEAQLRHLADIPVGTPLAAVDLAAVMAGVERHPWVASAEARRVVPDTVRIEIRERVPRAVLVLDGFYLVDTEGTPFRRADPTDLDRVLLTGLDPDLARDEPDLARRILVEALDLVDAAVATGALTESEISEVRFGAHAGYSLGLRNGGELLLGFRGTPALARLPRLVAAGVDLTRPNRIDLGLAHHAVVTPS